MNTRSEAGNLIRMVIDLDEDESEVYAQCERVKRMLENDLDPFEAEAMIVEYLHTHYHK